MAVNAMPREDILALREAIARIEGKPHAGLAREPRSNIVDGDGRGSPHGDRLFAGGDRTGLEMLFPAGLPVSGLIEIRGAGLMDAAAVTGFGLALGSLVTQDQKRADLRRRLMWIGEPMVVAETGRPHATGLRDFGIDPARIVYGAPRRLAEALWLADTALASRAFAVVLMEIRSNPKGFGLTESRRLSLRARDTGCLLILLRQGGVAEAGSTLMRLRIEPMPAAERLLPDGRRLDGSLGNPVFRLVPEKSRMPMPAALTLEWNVHEHLFSAIADVGVDGPSHPVASFSPPRHGSDRPQALGTVLAFERAS